MEQNKDQISAAVRGEAVAEFNINDTMIVTLTEFGAKIWNDRWNDIPVPGHLIPNPVSAGHVLKDQMWDLMKTFGPHIYLGGDMPFLNAMMAHEKVSARAADALDSQPSITAALKKWEAYAFSTSLDEQNDDLCQMITELMALDSQPNSRPTVKQLAAQLCDGQTWTVAEQNSFAEVLACFPNESSAGIISLGDAWKHGQAFGKAQASSQPTDGGVRNG